MARPDKADFTGASVTEGNFKIAHDALIDWLDALLGAVDSYIRLARGTDASRPAATEGGWLRWNTDSLVIDIAMASGLWHKMVTSIIDANWFMYLSTSVDQGIARFKSTHAGNVATIRVENNANDNVEVERTATHTIVRSSGTDPVRIEINGVAMFSIDGSGNVIAAGNITANSTPL